MEKLFEWNAKNFYTAKELESYIEPIRQSLVGKTIDKIMIMGHIFTSVGLDDQENRCVKYSNEEEWFIEENMYENSVKSFPTHQVALELDEPLVLCFGDNHFEIEYCEFSNAQVAMNTLNFNETSNVEGCVAWKDVSNYYNKNIIGQKLSDIKICYTPKPNEYVSHYRKVGENMYDEVIFIFENGYQLEISSDIDYMTLYEQPIWQHFQDLSKDIWDDYSKYNVEDNKFSFAELIKNSVASENNNLKIVTETTYGIDLDITFECEQYKSQFWLAESVNWVPNIFRFLEAIIYSKDKECFYYCEEEGPDTFLYAKNLSNNKIRFIHLSPRIQFQRHIQCEDYKIRFDIIVDKKEFVKTFYNSIISAINKVSMKELEIEWDYQIDEYKILKKGSCIIEKYIGI